MKKEYLIRKIEKLKREAEKTKDELDRGEDGLLTDDEWDNLGDSQKHELTTASAKLSVYRDILKDLKKLK
jgi:hypothetical protein